jgi:hypothetical protein
MDLILSDCTRPSLAETGLYQYSRGGSDISGPSIRLAETMARRWGNIASGIKEVSRAGGYSECVAYSWDLETGYYDERQFQVRHWRDTRQGGYLLTDERDIYELIANVGQRRKRAVLLTVLPGDVVEAAREQCERTLKASADTSVEALRRIVQAFGEFGVTQAQIEKRIQRRMDSIHPAQVVQLRKIYASLKDEMSSPSDWFQDNVWTQMADRKQSAQAGGQAGHTQQEDGQGQTQQTQAGPSMRVESENKRETPIAPEVDTAHEDGALEGFEGWVADEHNEPLQPEPITDPVAYVKAVEHLWQDSKNRDALIENNRDCLESAGMHNPEAGKIAATFMDRNDGAGNFALIVVPEGRGGWPAYVDAVAKALQDVPPARLEEWSLVQGPSILRAPQMFRVKFVKAVQAFAMKADVPVPPVILNALQTARGRNAPAEANTAGTTATEHAQEQPKGTGGAVEEGGQPQGQTQKEAPHEVAKGNPEDVKADPDAERVKAEAAADTFVAELLANLSNAIEESKRAGRLDKIVECLANRAVQSTLVRLKTRYAGRYNRVLDACIVEPVVNVVRELEHSYPIFVDDVNARQVQQEG